MKRRMVNLYQIVNTTNNNIPVILLLFIGVTASFTSYSFHAVYSFAPSSTVSSSVIRTAATETDQLLQSIQQLDLSARSSLVSGKVYQKVRQRQRFVEAWVVQDVPALPEEIWEVLLDFNQYSTRIPAVTLSEIYAIEAQPPQQQQPPPKSIINTQRRNHKSRRGILTTEVEERLLSYYAHFQIKFMYWISLDCYIRHNLLGFGNPNDTTASGSSSPRFMTWTLDPTRTMETLPLKDCTGLWHVIPHPTKPSWSMVYSSIQLQFQNWVPPLLIRLGKKNAISMATHWISRYFAHTMSKGVDGSLLPSSHSPPHCNSWNGPLVSGSISHVATSTACPWSESTATSTREPQTSSIGTVRYILVILVFLLTLANLYLFLERLVT